METVRIGNLVYAVAPETDENKPKRAKIMHQRKRPMSRPQSSVAQSEVILARAKKLGKEEVRKIGEGGMIDRPIESNGWLVMPIEMFERIIPPETMQQAEELTRGVPIKGFLIADDLRHVDQQPQSNVVTLPKVSPDWGKIATGIGKVAAVVAIGTAVVTLLPVILGIGAIGAALTYDPLIIAVTAEDEWIVVAEWWD